MCWTRNNLQIPVVADGLAGGSSRPFLTLKVVPINGRNASQNREDRVSGARAFHEPPGIRDAEA